MANFERELKALIDTHRNVPSIVMWVPFNEGWGQFDTVDPIANGRQTAGDLHAPFVEIAGAGHVSMLGDPVAVAHAIDKASTR